ncbi:glycosyl transferase [Psychrobacter sp. C 20.9]|uniref:glycosyltransferase n=1 Tax=Psychrobacter sp. C 20.9 TaxID=1926477 RepID=UPI000946941D|nr:glycosyltransferase [Psychrobacter sp. C 20.9]OLF37265.1 glycosyl transferase [Psychrobacter sp. C 20.9]
MKKVALYIPSMNGGGAERVMLALANGLAEKDILVDLVLNRVDGPYIKDASPKVNIVNLGTSRVLNSIIPLSKYLYKEKPDAILSAMNYVNIATILAQLISGSNTKVVFSEHCDLTESKKNLGRMKSTLVTSLMRWAYKKPHAIIAVSDGVAHSLVNEINIGRNKITTIYNPIFSKDLVKRSKEPLSHCWTKEGSLPLIMGVGRLTHQKDFETLIHAFKKVREKKDCNLMILGEGKLRSELEQLINNLDLNDSVQLPGFVDNPYAWMSHADLFVLSSIYEGFGNVLVEAMACGTPVVSTDCPSGPSEILADGLWGELVPPRNSNLLAQAIIKTLNNSVQKDVKDRASFFSVTNSVDKYYELLTR